jgi:DNA-binding MarR family transcriptional regulator
VSRQTQATAVGFLLMQVCRLNHKRAHELLEGLGLYRGQPPLLRALHHEDGLTHSELAIHLQVTPATITKMIQRVEKAGFVQRKADESDQRVSRVYLTDAGRAVQAQMDDALQKLEAETLRGFSRRERDLLQETLLRVRENLRSAQGGEA